MAQAVHRRSLRHRHQRGGHCRGLRRLEAGGLLQRLGDARPGGDGGPLDPGPDAGVAGDVGLEEQAGRLARDLDEGDVRPHDGGDDVATVRRLAVLHWLEGTVHGGQQVLAAGVHHRQVEVELGREVPVQHRLAHQRAVGDVVHRHVVVALAGEQLLRDGQQLVAALVAAHPRTRGAARRRCRHGGGRVPVDGRDGAHPVMVASAPPGDSVAAG
jgi:hypothetical protein